MSPTLEPRVVIDENDHEHVVNLKGRSLRRTVCIALAVAGALVAGPLAEADAAVSALATPSSMPSQPGQPGQIFGLGEVAAPGCASDAYKVPFVAATDGDGVWTVSRPAALGWDCDAITYGTAAVFVGSWDAEVGGCVPDRSRPGASICIGAMPHRGALNGVAFRLCPDALRCFVGEAWLTRT
jgi:hypothetical protein